jgi:predicted permease
MRPKTVHDGRTAPHAASEFPRAAHAVLDSVSVLRQVRARMTAIVDVVVPVFAIILAGYLCGRFGLLGRASSEALNAFVYYVALPALFLGAMARVPLAEILNWPFLIAFFGGLALVWTAAMAAARWLFPNRLAGLGMHGMAATFANTGYMGIPLLITAFGEAAALPAIIATVGNSVVVMAAAIVIIETDLSRGHAFAPILRDVFRGVARSPLVLSGIVGIALSATGWGLPSALGTFCDILGAAAPPCALFAMGLFMVGNKMTAGAREVAWLSALKLAVQPLVTWVLATQLVTMDRFWIDSAVILAALPTGSLVFVLAQQYGVYTQRATSTILATTLLSVVTLSALFLLLGVQGRG